MNKKEIIKILKKYNFDNKKYIVISGASMVLQGVKNNTNDIDIAVTKDYYDYLLKYFKCSFDKINIYGHKVYFIDNINYQMDKQDHK